MFAAIARNITNYEYIIVPYLSGEANYVEGYVTDLELSNGNDLNIDKFKVEYVDFNVGTLMFSGLQKTAVNGGPVNHEGLYVKIYYVTYDDENYIVELTLF